MENFMISVILLCIIGSIIRYLYKAKKQGQGCIGCPYSKQCKSKGACAAKQGAEL